MNTEYAIRTYQPGDELQIVPLLILGFEKWPFFDIECSPVDARAHTGYFVDLLALSDRIDVAEALLLDGMDFFRDNHVNHVLYQVAENHPYERLFTSYGFYGGEGSRHIFYNNYGNDDLGLENIPQDKFHFPFGELSGI
jgi:hypothetical protein